MRTGRCQLLTRFNRRSQDEGPLTSAATATVVFPVVTIVADSSSALYRVDDVSFTLTRTGSTAKASTVRGALAQDQPFRSGGGKNVRFAPGSATATLTIPYWEFLFLLIRGTPP